MTRGNQMGRREFLISSSAFSLAALTASGAQAKSALATRSDRQRSPFGANSTAEEVTSGLDLSGKTAVITGCNSGIGYETLRVLVLRGAHVYGLARTLESAEKACTAVTGGAVKGTATPLVCELTQFSSVAACAESIPEHQPIDILICNAGIYGVPTLQIAEGLEKHFVVNHLSHFLLVNRLLDRVKSARGARIVVVASDEAYKGAPAAGIEFDNLSGQRYYDEWKMYGQSKLANVLFVRELARQLSGTSVTANAVHPGWVMTEGMRQLIHQHPTDPQQDKQLEHELKTPAQGAATTCYVATSPALDKVSGAYFEDCNIVVSGGRTRDDALARKLWRVSEQLTTAYRVRSTP